MHAAVQPEDIRFVLDVADHLYSGNFAPRSEHADDRRDFEVVVAAEKGGEQTTIVIPDISGELWLNAAEHGVVSTSLMEEMRSANGALLFVRVNSEADIRPLNWVTSKQHLAKLGNAEDQGLQLAGLRASRGETHAVDDVVEARFENLQQSLARGARTASRLVSPSWSVPGTSSIKRNS